MFNRCCHHDHPMVPPELSSAVHQSGHPPVRRGEGESAVRVLVVDRETEVLGDAGQTRGVALAHGAELPVGTVAVQLAEDHGGLGGRVLGEVVARELLAAGLVGDADVRVADLAEVLLAGVRVVHRHREDDLGDVRGDRGQVDLDLLVVALALAGEVVAGVLDGTVGRLQVVEVDEVPVTADDLVVLVEEQRAGVEVEVRAGGGTHVPSEADRDGREAGGLLGETDVAALAEGNTHDGCLSFRDSEAPLVGVSGGVEHTVAVAAVQKEILRTYCRLVK